MTKEQLLEYIDVYIRQQGDYGAVRIAPVLEALVKNMGKGGVIPSGPTSGRPENPVVGTQYFDTDLGKVVTWDGSGWVESGGGTGAVVLHADMDSPAKEQSDGVIYLFTETQEEIDKMIDSLGGAETATAFVVMMQGGSLAMIYSFPMFGEESINGYGGIAAILDTDINNAQKVQQHFAQMSISKTSGQSQLFIVNSPASIEDYLAVKNEYQEFQGYSSRTGGYLNTKGEYVENENFNVFDLYPEQGVAAKSEYRVIVVKDNDTSGATDISVFSNESRKPISYAGYGYTYVCFNSPFARYVSVHKDAKLYYFNSMVLETIMTNILNGFKSLGIDTGSIEQAYMYRSEASVKDKYNNVNGETVDSDSFLIYSMSLKKDDILTFSTQAGNATDMAALKDADSNIVPAVTTSGTHWYAYLATKDTTVEISTYGSMVEYTKANSIVFEFVMQSIGKTRDMMGINGTMQQLYPEVAQEGKYNRTNGEIGESEFYKITAPISLKEGETLLVKTISTANVRIIKDADGNVVDGRQATNLTPQFYSYTATKDTTVEVSCGNTSYIYKFSSAVFEQLAKQIAENKKALDNDNLLLELPYLVGNFSTPTLGDGITDMPTLVAKIKAAKSVTLRNPSGASVGCMYWNAYSNDTAVRLITVADTLNQENVLRSNVQITYTASSGNFSVNIVPEKVTNTLVLTFPTFNGTWNVATLADDIDDMETLLGKLASKPVVLLQSVDNEFRQCLRYVADEQRVYFYTVGNKINGTGGNIYTVFNVTYDTDTAQFTAQFANYPDASGGNFEIVTELPETPDENKVYIIKGS